MLPPVGHGPLTTGRAASPSSPGVKYGSLLQNYAECPGCRHIVPGQSGNAALEGIRRNLPRQPPRPPEPFGSRGMPLACPVRQVHPAQPRWTHSDLGNRMAKTAPGHTTKLGAPRASIRPTWPHSGACPGSAVEFAQAVEGARSSGLGTFDLLAVADLSAASTFGSDDARGGLDQVVRSGTRRRVQTMQRRGLFRTEYESMTSRDNLCLPRLTNRRRMNLWLRPRVLAR